MPQPPREAPVHGGEETLPEDPFSAPGLASPPSPGPTPPAARWPWGSGDPARYTRARFLGSGGMGEVWATWDNWLHREVALKRLLAGRPHGQGVARFTAEARTAGRLLHPALVPVLDVGIDAEGRGYYTMPVVQGEPLSAPIARVHQRIRVAQSPWTQTEDGWSLRRLVECFAVVCDAIAFCHAQGVLHLDLKPANIMVGRYSEVTVMDWGLTEQIGARVAGPLPGTPGWQAPEAIAAEVVLGAPLDIYSLGVTLYQLLHGALPSSPTDRRPAEQSLSFLAELPDLCAAAMRADPARRLGSASALATGLRAWLDGLRRRERALSFVAAARLAHAQERDLRAEAEALQAIAQEALRAVAPSAPVEDKRAAWAQQDEAKHLEDQADQQELRRVRDLSGALAVDPELPEAHEALADYYRDRHAQAEEAGDPGAALRLESLLAEHDRRDRHLAYRRGTGALSLVTDPAGATATLYRYVERGRRLVPVLERALGPTPLVELSLPPGRYLIVLEAEGCLPVRYPVALRRCEHWDGVPPQGTAPSPIVLPRLGSLEEDDVYVPAGWFWRGGDPLVSHGLPLERRWLFGFVIKRSPVTCETYAAFLNDRIRQGREAEVEAALPARAILPRGADGLVTVGPDPQGDLVDPRWPALWIRWSGARACARWYAERTGLPWRLPGELAWEKAARGVDRRAFPWGDSFDPSFCNMQSSRPNRPFPATVEEFPLDESPYGVRGMAGNSVDWTADRFAARGQTDWPGVGPDPTEADDDGDVLRVPRGGSYTSPEFLCRSATRFSFVGHHASPNLGLRLAMAWGEGETRPEPATARERQ